MIIGHGPLAFALVALVLLVTTSFSKRKILYLAAIAGIASILPDVDVLFPLISLLSVDTLSITVLTEQFWAVSGERHRLATHSLIVFGTATLIAYAQMYIKPTYQKYSIALSSILIFILPLALPVQLLFGTTLVTVYTLTKYKPKTTKIHEPALAFAFGAFLHPFGDMFTGTPPAFLYPFTDILQLSRWTIADPTLHFILIFTLEIGSLIAALSLIAHLTDFDILTYTDVRPKPHQTLVSAIALATALFVIGTNTTPTVDSATTFVLPLVGATTIAATPTLLYKRRIQQYLSDISWTLLFAIIAFTLYYALSYKPL